MYGCLARANMRREWTGGDTRRYIGILCGIDSFPQLLLNQLLLNQFFHPSQNLIL